MRDNDILTLAHGGGGSLTRKLIDELILQRLGNPILAKLDDGACLRMPGCEIVFTTDSYVVDPLFFPGGDIGRLSVCGTVNDLAMQGAEPKFLSLGLILEEGLALSELDRILNSIGETAEETGVMIVTGDTKVVERGNGNGVFINTSGIGSRIAGVDVYVGNAQPGDAVIVTGTIGDHGIAVLSKREGLAFESSLTSDVAPLWSMTKALLDAVPSVRSLRDPTRGGLTAAMCDIAQASGVGIRLNETDIPVRREVTGACKLLGLDPLDVANEGKAVVVCPADGAEMALSVLRAHESSKDAAIIGSVVEAPKGKVLLRTGIGGERILEMPTGENLPRIC